MPPRPSPRLPLFLVALLLHCGRSELAIPADANLPDVLASQRGGASGSSGASGQGGAGKGGAGQAGQAGAGAGQAGAGQAGAGQGGAGQGGKAGAGGAGQAGVGGVTPGSCEDGLQNGAETDIDCGGGTCARCAVGQSCLVAGDCQSNQCAGGVCVNTAGCSDGQREGYTSLASFPTIAACSGGWSVPGVVTAASMSPQCGRVSGDDSANSTGLGCSVADLCQVGWHVCASVADVASHASGVGCGGDFPENAFYTSRQTGSGNGLCDSGGNNDLFGCGTLGDTPHVATCGVLDHFSQDLCGFLTTAWSCGNDGFQEAAAVTKSTSSDGGVLCCRDAPL